MARQRAADRPREGRAHRGASLPDLLIALAFTGLLAAPAWSTLTSLREERAGREAARGVAADLRRLAHDTRRLRRAVAVEFDLRRVAHWRVLVDGNGNGVTSADITAGIDQPQTPWTPVFREGRARLAIERDLPDADGTGTLAAGSAPVRLGAAPRLTFTPRGTGTAGSLHVAGPDGRAYVVRVLGTTQRIRLLCLSADEIWEVC